MVTTGMKKIEGLFPPIITTFGRNEEFDEESMRSYVDFLIDGGVHGLIPGGSTGEFISMEMQERKKVAEVVIDHANDRVPVIVGTHHYSTKKTIELSKHAKDIGADAVLIVPPYYMIPTEKEIYEHYKAISQAVDIPIMVYNNPRYSADISPETIVRMFKEGLISYAKEADGDPSRVQDMILLSDKKLPVFYGHDINTLSAFALGAKGWISGINNLIPKLCRELYDTAVEKKDLNKSVGLWYKMLPLVRICCISPRRRLGAGNERPRWLQIVKRGLTMIGQPVGEPRRPLTPLSREEEDELKQVLKDLGLVKAV